MKLCVLFCVFAAICGISFADVKRYDGYKVYRVTFERERAQQVKSLIEEIDGVEIWMFSMAEGTADVFVAPNVERYLLAGLRANGLTVTLLNGDVQGTIDGTALE